MGTSSSQDTRRPIRGGIQVQIPKTGFISGEAIQGFLNVSLEENYQGHILQVALEGIEETHYTYTVSSGSGKHRHTRTVHAHGINKFLDFSIPVYDFAQGDNRPGFTLSPGQWSIPFSIVVASQLPSSLMYFQTTSTNCSLKYRINASIIPTDQSVRPVQGIQDIFVAQQVNLMPVEQSKSHEFQPNTFCCCGSDKLTISGSTDKPCYSPGETAVVLVKSDLSSYGSTVKTINVELNGVLIMKTQSNHRQKAITIFTIEKQIQVSSKNINERVEIPIPPGISLTSVGNLVNLQYSVRIKPVVDGCCQCECSGSNLMFMFPIIINPTSSTMNMIQMPQQFAVQAPQNWNPTMLQPTQFTPQQTTYIQEQQAQYSQMQMMQMQQQMAPQNGNTPLNPMAPSNQMMGNATYL